MQVTKPVKAPRKQRKQLYTAPAHLRHKFMTAPLSPELAASKGVKALPLRKGDTVQVMRGDHKGFEGKVSRVDLKRRRIFIEGLTREKVDGTTIFVPVHPSKVMIKNLKLDDKWRQAVVERKKQALPKKEKAPKKVKLPEKAAAVEAEKVVKESGTAAAPEKPQAEKPEVKPKTTRKKPAAKETKEEFLAEEKAPAKRKKKAAAESEAKSVEKEKNPEKVKKARAKRKSDASTKKGGT